MPTVATGVVLSRDEETLYGVDPVDGEEYWTTSATEMGTEFVIVEDPV